MFSFEKIGPDFGDCTASYKIILDKEYRLIDFITAVLSRESEWGYIGLRCEKSFLGNPCCEYKYGKIIKNSIPRRTLTKKITNVSGSGGWSRMDYLFDIDPEDPKPKGWIKKCDHVECPKCGVEVWSLSASEYTFCPYCGERIIEEGEQ